MSELARASAIQPVWFNLQLWRQTAMPAALQQRSKLGEAIVLGLRWDRWLGDRRLEVNSAADLDATCELRDSQGRLLELVGPGRPRNINGSVMHTGDSRTGASPWDDERIYIFVEALPRNVYSLTLLVESSAGAPFAEIANPSCHVSDAITEERFVTVHLDQMGTATECVIATLQRTADGWTLISGRPHYHRDGGDCMSWNHIDKN